MELDGYNEALKLAFEYHGKQHFEFIEHFHKNHEEVTKRIQMDQAKEH
jgi:GR25 family glycosyltransferase involved in LPS biosynthesis